MQKGYKKKCNSKGNRNDCWWSVQLPWVYEELQVRGKPLALEMFVPVSCLCWQQCTLTLRGDQFLLALNFEVSFSIVARSVLHSAGRKMPFCIRCESVHIATERQLDPLECNWVFALEAVLYRWNSASWYLGKIITYLKCNLISLHIG